MESKARQIHSKVNQSREAGESLEALKLSDEALIAYQEEGDLFGFVEILADRSITFRHLHDATEDISFLIVSKHEVSSGIEIARKNNQKEALAIPLARLANVLTDLGEYQEAVASYKEALEIMSTNPPARYNRPGILADMKAHLATTEYQAGDKSALERARTALTELEASEEDSYNKNVWISGAYMRMADMLRKDNPQEAKEYLEKAKEIIDSDQRLSIRLKQWGKLAQTIQ